MNNKTDVLVVDDDPGYCELAALALHACGQRNTRCVNTGQDALDFLHGRAAHAGRDQRSQPRLVLLDLKLVGMQGLEVLHRIRAEASTAAVPVVVLSGTDDQAALRACYDAGANSVVRKTADYAELERKLRGIFEFWLNVNEETR